MTGLLTSLIPAPPTHPSPTHSPQPHPPIHLRYGVQEFVVLAPSKEEDALCSEAQTKLIASSVAIAIKNTGW